MRRVRAALTWIAFGLLAVRAERLPIQSYTTADGLADNHINRIRNDSRGFLWFATDEGLSRFDGHSFVTYTTSHGLPHPWVNDLIETRTGEYWVATDGGICQFDATRQSSRASLFTCYDPGPSKDARRVNALLEDPSGAIWCATYDGIYRLEPSRNRIRFQQFHIGSVAVREGFLINNLLLDRNGMLWAAASAGIYRRLPNGAWERFTKVHGLPTLYVETMFEDHRGRLWAGTRTEGLCRLIPVPTVDRPIVEHCYSVRDGLPSPDIRSLFETADGRFWIATTGGLVLFSADGNMLTYTTMHGLGDSVIYRLAEDREGHLWMGTKHAGVAKVDLHGFVSYGEADGFEPGDYVSSIFETQPGRLCVTSGNSKNRLIQWFDGRRFRPVAPAVPPGLWNEGWAWEQATLLDRDGFWWIATGRGLFRFPPVGSVGELSSMLPRRIDFTRFHSVASLYQDRRGNIWIGSSVGRIPYIFRWDHTKGTGHRTSWLPASTTKRATAFTEDRSGKLWVGLREFGTGNGGILRCSQEAGGQCQAIDTAPAGDIHALYTDSSGRIWAATSWGGLGRCDNPLEPQPRFASYTTSSGLSSNEVWCLVEDRFGRIYAGTSRGVDRLDPSTGLIRHFTAADGLGLGRIQASYRDRSGTLWFATHQMVSRFDPQSTYVPRPVVRITGLRISGVARAVSDLGETRIGPVSLSSSENSLEVQFGGLDYSGSRNLRYQFRLGGASGAWSDPTEARAAAFPRLPAGSYHFLVRALDSDGSATPEPASLVFTIAPHLWQRWWFILATAGTLVLSGWALHRRELSRLLAMERVRSRIATDLHDEIGSSLSRMAILSEVVQRELGPTVPEDSMRLLSEIAGSARALMSGMSDVVWSIDPRRDDLASLAVRVREFASDMFAASGVEWQFLTPSTLDHAALDPGQRRELFLIYKESIANVVRHSSCSIARLSLEHSGGRLTAEVQDNGCGFSVNGQRGHGLDNIESRARRLGGSCEIVSAPNQGTRITVIVPHR